MPCNRSKMMAREGSKRGRHPPGDAPWYSEEDIVVVDEGEGCEHELIHENPSTRIRVYRLHYNPHRASADGGCPTGSVAVKVLGGERPDPESLKRLHDEYIVSNMTLSSSRCSALRTALRYGKFNGDHAIFLQWVECVTLGEWVRSNIMISSRDAVRNAVLLGCVIAGAVAELHEAGIVHNNITTDNIMVDDHSISKCPSEADGGKKDGCGFSVKLIGLGSALFLQGNYPRASIGAIQKDLCSLGEVLYAMFSGECASIQQNDSQELQRKAIASDDAIAPYPPSLQDTDGIFRRKRILRCLAMLLSKLTRTGKEHTTGGSYHSANEVKEDLDHIYDFPDSFLVDDVDLDVATGRVLEFVPGRLYGRTAEVSAIYQAFDRVIQGGGQSELILISGASGTGKTALVRHMQKPFVERGATFLTGKFDLLRQVEVLSAITAAFTGYCESVLAKGGDDLLRARTALQDVVGLDGILVLSDLIPVMHRVMGRGHGAAVRMKIGGKEAQQRLTQLFRLFARAISSKSHPLVLFLDDLQWADDSSLNLIRSLIVDNENNSLLLIGSYRDNEVRLSHPLIGCIDNIKTIGVSTTNIEIQNIPKDAINHMIAETLCVPLSVSNGLAGVIHDKTDGNFLFATQYLASLCDLGLLRYSAQSGSWQWNLHQIESIHVADSASGLILKVIADLPARIRRATEVAACLGSHCDENILRLITNGDVGGGSMENTIQHEPSIHESSQLAEALDVAVARGIMVKEGSRYCFLHDQICQAALSLIPEAAQAEMHQRIGMCIWKRSSQANLEENLFVAADHLYLGSSLVSQNDRIGLAQLYLRAGQKAISQSLFVPASTYLKAGIALLGPGHWEKYYQLTLRLYELYADCEYITGQDTEQVLDLVLTNAKCFEDRLGAYYTLVTSLGSRGKAKDAIMQAFLVLEELGEFFPSPEVEDLDLLVMGEWGTTKEALDGFTDESIVTIRDMTDKRKLAAMKFLQASLFDTFLVEQKYLGLVTMRMVQLSVSHGMCAASPDAFAAYGLISCGRFGDVKRGYELGQLALKLLERFTSTSYSVLVISVVYGCIHHWKEHLRQSLDPLLRGYRVGMRYGDVENAMVCAYDYFRNALQSGMQLAPLEVELRNMCGEMEEFKQNTLLGPTKVIRQAVLNLMGDSDDPLILTGSAMDQNEMLKHGLEPEESYLLCKIGFIRMWLAYLYGDYALAADMAAMSRNIEVMAETEVDLCNHAYFDGLVSIAMYRQTKQKRWINVSAKKSLEKLKTWATYAPCNFQHKVALMEAEFSFAVDERSIEATGIAFEAAISLAGENGYVQDQALACERSAHFHLECNERSRASNYYRQAYNLYCEWGALNKAEHLRRQLGKLNF